MKSLFSIFGSTDGPYVVDGMLFDDIGDVGDYINQRDDEEGWQEYLASLEDPQNKFMCEECQ